MPLISDPDALYGRLVKRGVDETLALAIAESLHELPMAEVKSEAFEENELKFEVEAAQTALLARLDQIEFKIKDKLDVLLTTMIVGLGGLAVIFLILFALFRHH